MKSIKRYLSMALIAAVICSFPISAYAVDYTFTTDETPDYYDFTSYEDVYGSRYNYGGPNVVDYQVPELEYGSFSTTQTGIMEKALLPGLQQIGYTTGGGAGYGVASAGGVYVSAPEVLTPPSSSIRDTVSS